MGNLTLKVGKEIIGTGDDIAEILALIEKKGKDLQNPVLILEHSLGSRLYILLSESWCSAMYEAKNQDTYTLRSSSIENSETIRFYFDGHATHIHLHQCVKFGELSRIIAMYAKSGDLPDEIAHWNYWGKVNK